MLDFNVHRFLSFLPLNIREKASFGWSLNISPEAFVGNGVHIWVDWINMATVSHLKATQWGKSFKILHIFPLLFLYCYLEIPSVQVKLNRVHKTVDFLLCLISGIELQGYWILLIKIPYRTTVFINSELKFTISRVNKIKLITIN